MCTKRGAQIGDDETFYRNVNPSWIEDGQPSSQAFRPGSGDEGCVSTHRASLITAAGSHTLFTDPSPGGFGRASAGVWSILANEVKIEKLTTWSDPEDATATTPPNLAHAVIDMHGIDDKACRKIGKRLKQFAISRGRIFP
jgi:hypothetical protein